MNKLLLLSVLLVAVAHVVRAGNECSNFKSLTHFKQFDLMLKKSSSASKLSPEEIIARALNWFQGQTDECLMIINYPSHLRQVQFLDTSNKEDCTTVVLGAMIDLSSCVRGKDTLLNKALMERIIRAMSACLTQFKEAIPFRTEEKLGENLDNLLKIWAENYMPCSGYSRSDPTEIWHYKCQFEQRLICSVHERAIAELVIDKKRDEVFAIDIVNKDKAARKLEPIIWSVFQQECETLLPYYKGVAPSDVEALNVTDPETTKITRILQIMEFVYQIQGKLPEGLEPELLFKLYSYRRLCSDLWENSFHIAQREVIDYIREQKEIVASV